jgi:hypothetical protein
VSYLGDICVLVVTATLAASVVQHLVGFRGFVADIGAQRMVPAGLAAPLATAVILAEFVLAAGVLMLLVGAPAPSALRAAAGILPAVLFASYGIFAAALVRFRPGAPCACSAAGRPASLWTVVRAGLLTSVALGSLTAGDIAELPAAELSSVIIISVVSAVAIWVLPDALHVPGWRGSADKYAEVR